MNKTISFFLIILSFLCPGCNFYCPGKKVFISTPIFFPGDSLSIYVDSALIATKSDKELMVRSIRDKRTRVAEICATKDSILINVFYNSIDTSKHIPSRDTCFYIHPKDVNGVSIVVDVVHEIVVYLDKVNGGYGIYEPDSR